MAWASALVRIRFRPIADIEQTMAQFKGVKPRFLSRRGFDVDQCSNRKYSFVVE
jgi:hypothetical protein